MAKGFRPGDYVIYRKTKFSRRPGPRAIEVEPANNGDSYTYSVDKFWIVQRLTEDGEVILRTRSGKTHSVRKDDPLLRKANLLERWRYRDRFESAAAQEADESGLHPA